MNDLLIRPARPEDIPRMCELLAELFSIESDFSPNVEKQVHGLRALTSDPSGQTLVLVAVSNWAVIDMATVQTLISTAEGGRVGLIEDVIVAKSTAAWASVRSSSRGSSTGAALRKILLH
jgi:hypothetical protein